MTIFSDTILLVLMHFFRGAILIIIILPTQKFINFSFYQIRLCCKNVILDVKMHFSESIKQHENHGYYHQKMLLLQRNLCCLLHDLARKLAL